MQYAGRQTSEVQRQNNQRRRKREVRRPQSVPNRPRFFYEHGASVTKNLQQRPFSTKVERGSPMRKLYQLSYNKFLETPSQETEHFSRSSPSRLRPSPSRLSSYSTIQPSEENDQDNLFMDLEIELRRIEQQAEDRELYKGENDRRVLVSYDLLQRVAGYVHHLNDRVKRLGQAQSTKGTDGSLSPNTRVSMKSVQNEDNEGDVSGGVVPGMELPLSQQASLITRSLENLGDKVTELNSLYTAQDAIQKRRHLMKAASLINAYARGFLARKRVKIAFQGIKDWYKMRNVEFINFFVQCKKRHKEILEHVERLRVAHNLRVLK
eukprot:g3371.t1